MTQIILDSGASSKLNEAIQPVDLCDPSGRVLGRFLPLIDPTEWELVSTPASDEEIARRKQLKGQGLTINEVIARLEKL